MTRSPFSALAVTCFLQACGSEKHPSKRQEDPIVLVEHRGHAMGTLLLFRAYGPRAQADQAIAEADAEFRRLDALLTTWKPSGEPWQFARLRPGESLILHPETREVLEASLSWNRRSEGAFDVTFATLSPLWKFDEDRNFHIPTSEEIAAFLPAVGTNHLCYDPIAGTLARDDQRTQISFGGIAKGYAVDRAAAIFAGFGLKTFLIQAGGDLYAAGEKPDGSPFSAAVADPRNPERTLGQLPLNRHAFSTAGDYARSFVRDGRRYHHILDPRTGAPANACQSVTIWADTAFEADGLDDAVFVLGPERGLALVEATPGAGAVIVDAVGGIHVSERLRGVLTLTPAR
jgi:thiamine biosynthesis lipoprotein